MEYFCDEEGEFWNQPDQEIKDVAARELTVIEVIDPRDILDSVVIRVPKTYPAYLGSYPQFGLIRNFLDEFENLFLVGRNGMHRYNNMDHSMLTAIAAVDNIVNQVETKENIWAVNAEPEYVEVDH